MHLSAYQQLPNAFRVLPVGHFRANDNRKNGNWFLPGMRGRQIAALANRLSAGLLIDYEHESLKRADAPEAGRAHRFEWRDDGLYVTAATWTENAKALIKSGEKRFVSPVFHFCPSTGEVLSLDSIALTYNPALIGLTDLSQVAVACSNFQGAVAAPSSMMTPQEQENYKHVFGVYAEELAAVDQVNQLLKVPEGVSAEDWAKLHHVFGDLLHGQS